MSNTILYLAAFAAIVAVAVAMAIIAVRRDGRGVEVLIKQLIVWAGIVALLPLSSWAGASMIHPRTQWKELIAERSRIQSDSYGPTTTEAAREARAKALDEQKRLSKLIDEEQRLYYRAMFWVSYPIGLVALVVGLFLRSVTVGTGLAFGGLCTLTVGCYSYWDDMNGTLRFVSLLIVLLILIAIGLTKFRRPSAADTSPVAA